MKKNKKLALAFASIIITLLLTIILSEIYKPSENSGDDLFAILIKGLYTIVGVIVTTIIGNIAQDLIKSKGNFREVALEWLGKWWSNSSNIKQDVSISIRNLKDECKRIAEKLLAEIEGNEMSFIKKLNWAEYRNISKIKDLQIQSPEKHPIDIRQGIIPDKKSSLVTIIDEMKDKSARGFVILGLPGLGKTYSIQNYIFEKTDINSSDKPIVFFSLSYWTQEGSIVHWMRDELVRYKCPERQAIEIVENGLIIPVFDGLDQVNAELRKNCAKKIFEYSDNCQIILTSRPDEFHEVIEFFRDKDEINYEDSFSIIELLPLQETQVKNIVGRFNNAPQIMSLINSSKDFDILIKSPMVLYIVSKIQNQITEKDVEKIEGVGNLQAIELLWEMYEAFIFSKANSDIRKKSLRKKSIIFDEVKSHAWLSQIARNTENKRGIFLENLQPKFLNNKIDINVYYFLSRIFSSILLAAAAGFFMSGPSHFIGAGVLTGSLVASIELLSLKYEKFQNLAVQNKKSVFLKRLTLKYVLPVFGFLIIYFGFSTPRFANDMYFSQLFAVTEANVALLVTLFIGISYGVRESQYENLDIKPVERMSMNWMVGLWFGLKGGIILGTFLVLCVLFIKVVLTDSTFNKWINNNPYGLNIYVLAILVGFFFGTPLIGLLKTLKTSEQTEEDKERKRFNKKPNHGIRKSFYNLLRGSIVVGFIMIVVLGIFIEMLTHEPSCLIKGIKAGIGASLLAALWFGGFDVIHHFVLRFLICINNYGPWRFARFLEFSSRLRLTRPVGASFEFAHDTIHSYFIVERDRNKGQKSNESPGSWILMIIIMVAIGVSIWFPIKRRHFSEFYWSDANGFHISVIPKEIKKINNSTFVVNTNGKLGIDAIGETYLGSYVGYVGPEGTEAGVLGFRLGDAYDLEPLRSFPHGVLVVKHTSNNQSKFHRFNIPGGLYNMERFFSAKANIKDLNVSKNDTLQFIINDKEWQNNHDKYEINISYAKLKK